MSKVVITEGEKADLKNYISQEPFRLFKKVLQGYKEDVTDQIISSVKPEALQLCQGILKGLDGAIKVLETAAIHPIYGLEPVAAERVATEMQQSRIQARKPPRITASAKK